MSSFGFYGKVRHKSTLKKEKHKIKIKKKEKKGKMKSI